MVGSGWLFGAVIIMLIALCFAELAALFPRSGALVHMCHASHGEGSVGSGAGCAFGRTCRVPTAETEAIVIYANNSEPQQGAVGAVLVMWGVSAIYRLPFATWQQVVNYITLVSILTYGLGPVALLVLRRNLPGLKRPCRWRGHMLSPLWRSSAAAL